MTALILLPKWVFFIYAMWMIVVLLGIIKETDPADEMLKSQVFDGVLMAETENINHEPFTSNSELKVSYY